MPRQLRGPFEKATIQLSSAFESGCSQRSGRNSCGREKICSEKWTNRGLWLTTVYRGEVPVRLKVNVGKRKTNTARYPDARDHGARWGHNAWKANGNSWGDSQHLFNDRSLLLDQQMAWSETRKVTC